MTVGAKDSDEDKMRKMAELRTTLEKRASELQAELEQLKTLMDFVNLTLIERGFKKPEIRPIAPAPVAGEPVSPSAPAPKPITTTPPLGEQTPAIPIKTVAGDLLAELYTDDENMRVVLAKDKQFTADTPPFTAFLVQRVLAKMQEKDREAASVGEMPPEKILSYEITKDGDIIREINIANIGPDRSRELKSSIRWTLEKMHEKMKAAP
ncbi:MAG TPA: hypothetical protein VJ249_12005 [Candidatus Bathyarchaeia archaeon]|nr:hypothetical protein [Candidatus Bathyarchaeia archaeon]